MFRKQNPSSVLFTILVSLMLLTTVVLVGQALAGAGVLESEGAFVSTGAEVQESRGAVEQKSGEAEPQSATTVIYTYDDAGRMVEVDYGDKSISYIYDAAGNPLQQDVAEVDYYIYLPLVLKDYP